MFNAKNYVAAGATGKFLIAAATGNDGEAIQATAGAPIIGVFEELDHVAGERVDVIRAGIARVQYGGTIARNDPLTADARGRAVKATPTAGTNVPVIGFADVAGVDGDICELLVNVHTFQG